MTPRFENVMTKVYASVYFLGVYTDLEICCIIVIGLN